MSNIINISNNQKDIFSKNLLEMNKGYTEGLYSDTPANRKLGRVGMSYKESTEKKIGEEKPKGEKSEKLNAEQVKNILKEINTFSVFDNSSTSWRDANFREDGPSFKHYKTIINGKDYYALKEASGRTSYFLSEKDALNNKKGTVEDIIEDVTNR